MGSPQSGTDTQPLTLSCRALRPLLSHFQKTQRPGQFEAAIAEAGLPPDIDAAFLAHENNWVSFETGQKLLDALWKRSGDPLFPRKAGLLLATPEALGLAYSALRAFGSPALSYRATLANAAIYNRGGHFHLESLSARR